MKKQESKILEKFKNELDASKYKIYKESLNCFEDYAIINYQSNSVVDFNIPDENMIYGIGTLILRKCDERVFEIYAHLDKQELIKKILNT